MMEKSLTTLNQAPNERHCFDADVLPSDSLPNVEESRPGLFLLTNPVPRLRTSCLDMAIELTWCTQ